MSKNVVIYQPEEKVRLFSKLQMWYHKHIIHFMFIFILTGLPLVYESFSFIAYFIGLPMTMLFQTNDTLHVGIQVCRTIHRITAVLWIITSIPFIFGMLFTKWDLAIRKRKNESWGTYFKEETNDLLGSYLFFKYPKRAGKYNIGQILAGLLAIVFCILIAVSGIFLWARDSFSVELIGIMKLIHDISFYYILFFLVIHIYLAVFPTNRSGYIAMFTDGLDSLKHAKKKHPGMFRED